MSILYAMDNPLKAPKPRSVQFVIFTSVYEEIVRKL